MDDEGGNGDDLAEGLVLAQLACLDDMTFRSGHAAQPVDGKIPHDHESHDPRGRPPTGMRSTSAALMMILSAMGPGASHAGHDVVAPRHVPVEQVGKGSQDEEIEMTRLIASPVPAG